MKKDLAVQTLLDAGIPKEIIDKCHASIAFNDAGHQWPHIQQVIMNMKDLLANVIDPAQVPEIEKMCYLGCLMHDLGCRHNRKNHHLISYGLVWHYLDVPDGFMTKEEIERIAVSCLEHRSSGSIERNDIVSQLVAAADFGKPDVSEYIKRSFLTRYRRNTGASAELIDGIHAHLIKKFGPDGYAWNNLSKYTELMWGSEVKLVKRTIKQDNLKSLVGNQVHTLVGLFLLTGE